MFHVHNRKSTGQVFTHPSGKRLELQVGINKVSDELVNLFRAKIDYDPMLSIVEILDAPVAPLPAPEPEPEPAPEPEPDPAPPSLAPEVSVESEPEANAEDAEKAEDEKPEDKPRGRGKNK